MKVLVTGGTGFIGQHLVAALRDRGHEVMLTVREEHGPGPVLPPRLAGYREALTLLPADLRNFAQTARAVRQARPHVVVHLAARGATRPYLAVDEALRHNVHGTLNLLRACFERDAGIRRLVVARTPGERSAHHPYAASKAAAWAFCRMYAAMAGWPVVGAMIFQAYGSGQAPTAVVPAAVQAALQGEDLPLTGGHQRRDWIEVSDVAAGLSAVTEASLEPGATVELGRGEGISVLDIVSHIYGLVGGPGRPRPGQLADRPNDPPEQVADAADTARRIGWRAAIGPAQGLAALLRQASLPAAADSMAGPMG